jgi:hypothetical protein
MCPCTGHGNNSTCAAGAAAADGDDIVLLDQCRIPDAIVSVELDMYVFVEWSGWLVVAMCTSLFLLTIFMVMLMETNLLQVHPWTTATPILVRDFRAKNYGVLGGN